MIPCNQWPMNVLTVPKGSKSRAMRCHPKDAVKRSALEVIGGQVRITDPSGVRLNHSGEMYAETKLQGHRYVYARREDGEYVLFPRGLTVDNVYNDRYAQIVTGGMSAPGLPYGTAVDCELIWPGHPDAHVSTAIAKCPDKLRLKAFAIPIHIGMSLFDVPYSYGRVVLEKTVRENYRVPVGKKISIPEDDNIIRVLEGLYSLAREEKVEGYVLKGGHYFDWWKLKGVHEADVFVLGFKISEAETRYGMVTAVEVGCVNEKGSIIYMGNVSGFDLDEMEEMTSAYKRHRDRKSNRFMFRPLRVVYQEMAAQGKLKHGFFDSWRKDKLMNECLTGQFE